VYSERLDLKVDDGHARGMRSGPINGDEPANDCTGGLGYKAGIRCPGVAHRSLTPFSNENGVTLMAIG